jgi:hypothetical protein
MGIGALSQEKSGRRVELIIISHLLPRFEIGAAVLLHPTCASRECYGETFTFNAV